MKQIRKETKDILLDISYSEEQQKKAAKKLMQVAAQHRNSQSELNEKKQLTILQEKRAKVSIITQPFSVCLQVKAWKTGFFQWWYTFFDPPQAEIDDLNQELSDLMTVEESYKVWDAFKINRASQKLIRQEKCLIIYWNNSGLCNQNK